MYDVAVLITGETGTGKEVFARALHYLSPRSEGAFTPVNCGAIPADLMENELFGHEEGAYTGAHTSKPGIVQESDGGTLFLDEVDSLSPLAQVKLLRFLQEKEYRPLGSTRVRKSDIRLIAAANSNVEKALSDGKLRQDLFYRLNIAHLVLPPLRSWHGDIPILARHFLTKYAAQFKKDVRELSREAIRTLTFYHWPGNVRELENALEMAVILTQSETIQAEDIILPQANPLRDTRRSFREQKQEIVAKFERSLIEDLLVSSNGNVTKAARTAGKNRRAFLQLMHKHGIKAQS